MGAVDAIELLTQQHLEIESLLDQLESASVRAGRTRLRLCRKLGDLLAAHTRIEETILHRATKRGRTEKLLDGGLEAHLSVRRIAADLVVLEEMNEGVEAMLRDLRVLKKRHADEEEKELFHAARELLAPAWLEELGRRMEKMFDELMVEARRARASGTGPRTWRAPRNSAT